VDVRTICGQFIVTTGVVPRPGDGSGNKSVRATLS
jgi:hypothetical protein